MSGISKKQKSLIASECQKAGFRKSSRAHRRLYAKLYSRAYRKTPKGKQVTSSTFKKYLKKKGKQWNAERIKAWRKANPEKWLAISKRATANGLHRRHYRRNRHEQINRVKEYNRRINPTIGLKSAISQLQRSNNWENFEREFGRAALRLLKGAGSK